MNRLSFALLLTLAGCGSLPPEEVLMQNPKTGEIRAL
jgi:hypothetical protein